jgi:hypothetical protein
VLAHKQALTGTGLAGDHHLTSKPRSLFLHVLQCSARRLLQLDDRHQRIAFFRRHSHIATLACALQFKR